MTLRAGWVSVALGEISRVSAGVGFPLALQGRHAGDIPFFKVGDISDAWKAGEQVLRRAQHYVSHEDAKALRTTPLPTGSVVFAKIGAAIALNRRAILGQPSLVDNNVMALVPGKTVSPKYLFHFACTLRFGDLSRATTVPSIRKSDVEAVQVPLAPRDEQDHIVAEIEKQFTRLDAGVAALERLRAHLRRYRAAALKAACAGLFVHDERDGRDDSPEVTLRRLAENRPPRPGRKTKTEPVPLNFSIPVGWGRATLDELASLVTDGDHNPPRRVEAGVPHLTAKNVKKWRLTLDGCSFVDDAGYAQTRARYDPIAGDVIVTCVGTIGETAVVPSGLKFSADRNLAAVRLHPGGLLPEMLQIILNAPPWSTWLRSASGSTAQPHLYLGSLRMLPVPVPPLALQRRIVAKVAEAVSNVEALELAVDADMRRADRLRASILRAAFEGHLVAPDQPARAPAA